MKKIMLGLLAGLLLFGGVSTIAEAKTNVKVYLGVPYYDYQVAPDYLYDENRGCMNRPISGPTNQPIIRTTVRNWCAW